MYRRVVNNKGNDTVSRLTNHTSLGVPLKSSISTGNTGPVFAVVFSLLVPGIILAQANITNTTNVSTGMLTGKAEAPATQNITTEANYTENVTENITEGPPQIQPPEENTTQSETSENITENITDYGKEAVQNMTKAPENGTNIQDFNKTAKPENMSSQNLTNIPQEPNQTIENITNNQTQEPPTQPFQKQQPVGAVIRLVTDIPERVTRGETIILTAFAKNEGSTPAKNVRIVWEFPEGFLATKTTEKCSEVNPGESCISSTEVKVRENIIGKSKIRVVVFYE